jgi:hypothetical protein
MGIRLLAGRELDWNDVPLYDKAAVEPVIINQAFARKYFSDVNPVGQRLIRGLGDDAKQIEIIGVSANTSLVDSLGEEPAPLIQPLSNLMHSFIARVTGSPAVAAPELAKLIERMSQEPLSDISPVWNVSIMGSWRHAWLPCCSAPWPRWDSSLR